MRFGIAIAAASKIVCLFFVLILRRIRNDPRFREYSMEDYWVKTRKPKRD